MAWFSRMLVDRHVDLLICERPDGPVGVLRYDRDGPVAEVSIYLVPSRLGSGLGGTVLNAGETWLRSMHPEVTTLQADVLPSNGASHRMFENGGYVPVLQKLEKRLSL
jgi:RimJ/RimL family protein N-acetyltransferase